MRTEWLLGAANPWRLDSEAEHRAAQMMHSRVSSAMLGVELTHIRVPVSEDPAEDGRVKAIVRAVHAGLSDLLSSLEDSMDDYVRRHDTRAPR
jgi:hypothetical protein